MTGSQALDRTAGPPRWARRQEKTAGPADIDWPDRPDPIDLGWVDDYDWPEPEYPDPSWPGWGANARRRPMYLSNPIASDWRKDRHPDKPATAWDALHAGQACQPDPEPDKLADWEAGQ